MAVYIFCCNACISFHNVYSKGLVQSSVCQLPIYDFLTQHVISLWRDTTSELWTPILFSLLLNQLQPKLCLLSCNLLFMQFTFLQQFSINTIDLTLCVQQNRCA